MDSSKTPCIGICSTVYGDNICRGCKRYSYEIIRWNQFKPQEKEIIWHRLEKLQQQVVKEKISIENLDLFQQQLIRNKIRYNPQLNPFCWVFNYLEQKQPALPNMAELGLQIRPPYKHLNAEQLFRQLDNALYELSVAHFDLSQTRHLGSTPSSAAKTP